MPRASGELTPAPSAPLPFQQILLLTGQRNTTV